MTLPAWMRVVLFATAVMNGLAAIGFSPPASSVRAAAGLPPGEHPVYLATVALFVLLFGLGYLWCALTGRGDRLFIALAAVGKVSFFALLTGFWAAGALPGRAPMAGAADLVFGSLFVIWLVDTRAGRRVAPA